MNAVINTVNDEWVGIAEGDDVFDRERLRNNEGGGWAIGNRAHRAGDKNLEPFRHRLAIAQMGLVSLYLRRPFAAAAGSLSAKRT